MASETLQRLFDVGEQMLACLESGDLEHYFALVDERGTLLDTILGYRHPSEIDANWREAAEALSHQQAALNEAAGARLRTMQTALTRLEQVKEAQRSYLQPREPRNILNENLRV